MFPLGCPTEIRNPNISKSELLPNLKSSQNFEKDDWKSPTSIHKVLETHLIYSFSYTPPYIAQSIPKSCQCHYLNIICINFPLITTNTASVSSLDEQ